MQAIKQFSKVLYVLQQQMSEHRNYFRNEYLKNFPTSIMILN